MTTLDRREFVQSILAASLLTPQNQRVVPAWREERAAVLQGMQDVMGKLPPASKDAPKVVRLASEKLKAFTRIKLTYESELGDAVPAWLLIPNSLSGRAPAMLCLHQTTKIGKDEPVGLGGNANLHYAQELAERGFVCLAPDYPYLGENTFDPYANGYASCTMKGIVNHRRGVDVLQSLPEVNAARIGAIGHSLGGHNALFVAAFDERIKAVVTSCGFTSFRKYFNGDLTGWAGKRYMPRIAEKFGKDPARMPFDFPALLGALAPRPVFINAPLRDSNFAVDGVRDCVTAAQLVYNDVFHVSRRLVVEYPDAAHDFPLAVRMRAYEFCARWLKPVS
jgi:dienelactone hydrolase